MLYESNNLVKNPVKRMAELFDYKENFGIIKSKGSNLPEIKNEHHLCKICGRKQDVGMFDPKSSLIGNNTNDFYDYVRPGSDFICNYCYYLYKIGARKQQKKEFGYIIADTADIIVFNDKIVQANLGRSSKDNDFYKLVKNPPKEAFMIIFKKFKSIAAFDMCFGQSMPTIDSELIAINYGFERYFVPRYKILEGCQRALEIFKIAKEEKINLSKDTLLNSKRTEEFHSWLSHNVRGNKRVFEEYLDFIKTYDKGTRLAISIVWESFLADNK